MSKAARLTGKEKPKVQQPPQPIVSPDIVPGKFTEQDWFSMVEKDTAEDFIHDYIDEVLSTTMTRIYKLYIQKQLVPYTVTRTAHEMMHIIQWKYIERDEGETGDEFWAQDKEPCIGVVDSWAQGAVPKLSAEAYKRRVGDLELEETKKKTKEKKKGAAGDASAGGRKDVKKKEVDKIKEQLLKRKARFAKYRLPRLKPKPPTAPPSEEESVVDQVLTVEKLPRIYSTSTMSLSQSIPTTMTKLTTEESETESVEKSVSVVVSKPKPMFEKLDPDELPTHRVSLKFQIVNPFPELERSGSQFARRSTQLTQSIILNHQSKSKLSLDSGQTDKEQKVVRGRRFIPLEYSPSVLESINVVPGVTVIEGSRTKKLTKRAAKRSLEFNLGGVQPIASSLTDRALSVSDLLEQSLPLIHPMKNSQPLPPISQTTSGNNCNCTT